MLSIIFACLWIVAAQIIAVLPSRDRHWRAAYFLVAIGLPILIFVYIENGILVAILAMAGAMSILRYPVLYTYRWVRRVLGFAVKD